MCLIIYSVINMHPECIVELESNYSGKSWLFYRLENWKERGMTEEAKTFTGLET